AELSCDFGQSGAGFQRVRARLEGVRPGDKYKRQIVANRDVADSDVMWGHVLPSSPIPHSRRTPGSTYPASRWLKSGPRLSPGLRMNDYTKRDWSTAVFMQDVKS